MNNIQQFFINLFGPIWLKESWIGDRYKFRDRQLDAVRALSDPKKLQRAAIEAPYWDVREAAVNKISDPEVLKAAALNDANKDVRRAAVEKIDDPEVLKTVALNAKDSGVRNAAVNKISDAEVLKTIALNDEDWHVRKAAVEKIDDAEVLKTVALNAKDSGVRMAAVEKVTDAEVLKTIALNGDKDSRFEATRKLYKIAPMDAAEPMVELLTSKGLKDEDFLFLTEKLRFLYVKAIDQALKKKIEQMQGHYDTLEQHSDGYSCVFHQDLQKGYSHNFTLNENA